MNVREQRDKRDKRERKTTIWTSQMVDVLRVIYPIVPTDEVAEALKISPDAVRTKASALGIKKRKRSYKKKFWSSERVAYLRKHYPKGNIEEIAAYFGKSVTTIRSTAERFGICREAKEKETAPPKVYFGNPARIGKNQSEVTRATWTLVCSCTIDGYTSEQIATMTERSVEQVEEVIKLCRENGYLNQIKETRVESLAMQYDRSAGRTCSGFRNAGAE